MLRLLEWSFKASEAVTAWKVLLSALTGATVMGWIAWAKSLPPPIAVVLALVASAAVMTVLSIWKFHTDYDLEDYWAGIDPTMPGIKWHIRVRRVWEIAWNGEQGRQIHGACAHCDRGLMVGENDPYCKHCKKSLGTHAEYVKTMGDVLAERKLAWLNDKQGFKKRLSSNRRIPLVEAQ